MALSIFILSILFLAYTYFGYAFLIHAVALFRGKSVQRHRIFPEVSFVIAVWNEAVNIERKIANILGQAYPPEKIEIIFVSDGSTDNTVDLVRSLSAPGSNVCCYVLPERKGKAVALNRGIAEAHGEIVILTDARQSFEPDTLANLVSNFADDRVGAVSGALCLQKSTNAVGKSFSSYWDLEKWIRKGESSIHSVIGLTGAVCAIRRRLYEPMPEGVILDDVMIAMRILMKGYRVVFDEAAVAYDDAAIEYSRELRRKIRTLTGNFQLLSLMPELLSPIRNRFMFQYFSHKITRLLAPLFMFCLLVSNLFMTSGIFLYTLMGQLIFYSLACVGLLMGDRIKKHAFLTIPCTFIMLNYAVCMGFANFVRAKRNVWV